MDNPFAVFSPEKQSAEKVVSLFVENSPGVDSIQADGHAMLVGPRGAGKSMLLRYMEPDCQRLVLKPSSLPSLRDLPYYAAYLSVRDTDLDLMAAAVSPPLPLNDLPLNEHLLVLTVGLKILERAIENEHFGYASADGPGFDKLFALYKTSLSPEEVAKGRQADLQKFDTEADVIKRLRQWLVEQHSYASEFVSKLSARSSPLFERRLLRFSNFLSPLIAALKQLPSMPSNGRFFLAIDDADRLSVTQTKILNTWLSRRTSDFSIKVSYEMYGYKTFYTSIDSRIESPHDYQEIRVSDIYTSNVKISYRDRMRLMIGLRLNVGGHSSDIESAVNSFFPEDVKQRVAIERLRDQIRLKLSSSGSRSNRPRDDIYRYLMPEYITSLGGNRKSRSKYRYCGFDQLVDISSGVPRYFLEAAAKMYDRQLVRPLSKHPINHVSAEVQDSVVRDLAQNLFMDELEKLRMDKHGGSAPEVAERLQNLIGCLGAMFERIMNDPAASERRIFSFAISDQVSADVDEVLRLGLRHAYLSRSSIGRKEGFGRTERYVLSRRFAPFWNLDPSGFSAYKFLTNDDLLVMMMRPGQFRSRLRRGEFLADGPQLELPIEDD